MHVYLPPLPQGGCAATCQSTPSRSWSARSNRSRTWLWPPLPYLSIHSQQVLVGSVQSISYMALVPSPLLVNPLPAGLGRLGPIDLVHGSGPLSLTCQSTPSRSWSARSNRSRTWLWPPLPFSSMHSQPVLVGSVQSISYMALVPSPFLLHPPLAVFGRLGPIDLVHGSGPLSLTCQSTPSRSWSARSNRSRTWLWSPLPYLSIHSQQVLVGSVQSISYMALAPSPFLVNALPAGFGRLGPIDLVHGSGPLSFSSPSTPCGFWSARSNRSRTWLWSPLPYLSIHSQQVLVGSVQSISYMALVPSPLLVNPLPAGLGRLGPIDLVHGSGPLSLSRQCTPSRFWSARSNRSRTWLWSPLLFFSIHPLRFLVGSVQSISYMALVPSPLLVNPLPAGLGRLGPIDL